MRPRLKALALVSLGLFLSYPLINGTLLLYVSSVFTWLVALTAIALVIVGSASFFRSTDIQNDSDHDHTFSWGGLTLIALPIILGLLLPPRALGASTLANREVNIGFSDSAKGLTSSAPPSITREKNILDWLTAFQDSANPDAFTNQRAHVIGFVYRDGRFTDDMFMASRFVVRCCIADATAVGLIVRWPKAPTIATDQWVDVRGHFETGEFARQRLAILIAEEVMPVKAPDQPYLQP